MSEDYNSDIRTAVDIRFDQWMRESNLMKDMFRMYSCKMDDEQVKFLLKHAFVEGMVFGTRYAVQQSTERRER